jgi:hypothetical protein
LIERYPESYNSVRPHFSLWALMPDQVNFNRLSEALADENKKFKLRIKKICLIDWNNRSGG